MKPKSAEPYMSTKLPDDHLRALANMVVRTLGLPRHHASEGPSLVKRLFGDETNFGQLQACGEDDVRSACEGLPVERITAPKDLVAAFREFDPWTPVCPRCGRAPITVLGGVVSTLPPGAACPFCDGQVEIVPITLKRVAWTDSRLIDPEVTEDLRSQPGERLPLTDDGIEEWAGFISPLVLRSVREASASLTDLLYELNIRRRVFSQTGHAMEVIDFLQDPRKFGFDKEELIDAASLGRAAVTSREVTNLPKERAVRASAEKRESLLRVDGVPYLAEGIVGESADSVVYRAKRNSPLTECVTVKVWRPSAIVSKRVSELKTLARLARSEVPGCLHYTRIIPEVVASGGVKLPGGFQSRATVFRDKFGFDWTLEDVMREYPLGVPAEHGTWMLNRLLPLLTWIHRNGLVHGAIVPEHILIHPVNHGATLIDWSYAREIGSHPPVIETAEDFYPQKHLFRSGQTEATEIMMAVRCVIAALGGVPSHGDLPESVPDAMAEFLYHHGGYELNPNPPKDALAVYDQFRSVAKSVFGPPKYHLFQMPYDR